ncbi:MAG: hypothetical protein KAX05_14980 [Bacteroidales bacterium]|nr:hypothetical protein [Bacteroidales bacterium]
MKTYVSALPNVLHPEVKKPKVKNTFHSNKETGELGHEILGMSDILQSFIISD